jgi:hypothetical protein
MARNRREMKSTMFYLNNHVAKWASLAILSLSMVSLFLLWQIDIGLDLADEGYLWYGTQRILLGEVPIRDFQAYDPGRYYWSALFFYLLGGNGIVELRIAEATFQVLGLFAALYVISKVEMGRTKGIYLLLASLVLLTWMFPRHKFFDISLSVFTVLALARLLESPKSIHFFLTGLYIGLIAFFGRNHGVYGVLASLGAMLWLQIKQPLSRRTIYHFFVWGLGIFVGFLPIILMCIFVPGFGTAFIDSVAWIIQSKSTNIPLPIPWPWQVEFSTGNFSIALRAFFIGMFFVSLLGVGVLGVIWVFYLRIKGKHVSPILVASIFPILPFAHHAFSRADVAHLSQSIFPLLIAALSAFPLIRRPSLRWGGVSLLLVVSVHIMILYHPGGQYLNNKPGYVGIELSNRSIQVHQRTAQVLDIIKRTYDKYQGSDIKNNATFAVLPYFPGMYAIHEKKSPIDIGLLINKGLAWEARQINQLELSRPNFIFLSNHPLDGLEERRFSNINPNLYRYIREHFSMVNGYPLKGDLELYEAKDPTD